MDLSELFWESDWSDLAKGYVEQESGYVCLQCGEVFEVGVIYPVGEKLLEACRAVEEHLRAEHESMVEFLLGLHKKHTGLSETQVLILQKLGTGSSDATIASSLDIAQSTVRNHRFRLKEKARQARVFLALMSLVEAAHEEESFVAPHRSATMIDERYAVTHKEQDKIRRSYFDKEGRLKTFPAREKKKLVVLRLISAKFETGRDYTEKEVNAVLSQTFVDFVTLRRYLIQYGFFVRENDGSAYRRVG
ncbi:MAG: DUF2087 domain-containing protein [Deltaproteobacteria bacterium]|nr:MAG: DUF2087 domain-containing protein [Deltaproteobacteria bacterium]